MLVSHFALLMVIPALAGLSQGSGSARWLILVDQQPHSTASSSSANAAVDDPSADEFHFSWPRNAALHLDTDAQLNRALGAMKTVGGVADYQTAARLLEPLAQQRNAVAETAMAQLLMQGLGVTRDSARAAQLLLDAANQNYSPAQYMTGLAYARGEIGTGPHGRAFAATYMWIKLAADQLFPAAISATAELSKRLTPSQIDQAEQIMRAWKVKLDPLHLAAASGQTEKVTELLRRGLDPNSYDSNGLTPLMRASSVDDKTTESSRAQIVKALVEHGADANGKSLPIKIPWSPISRPETTALSIASENGSVALAAALIAAHANVNERFAGDRSALIAAAGSSSHVSDRDVLEVVRTLVKAGADVNAEASGGASALFEAARTDRFEVAKFLMDSGVNRDAPSTRLALSRAKGTDIYPMMIAAGVSEAAYQVVATAKISPLVEALPKPSGDIVYEGQDGRSAEDAIKVHGAKNNEEGTAAIVAYFKANKPTCALKIQQLLIKDDQKIDAITCEDKEGVKETLYFDITESFGEH